MLEKTNANGTSLMLEKTNANGTSLLTTPGLFVN
jgi:hypothetical protein